MSRRVDIQIGGQTDPSLDTALARLTGGLGSVQGILGGIKGQLAALVGAAGFGSLVRMGVDFNSQLQIAQRSIASVFSEVSGGTVTFDQAMARAGRAVDMFRETAKTSSASFEDMIFAYSRNASGLFAAGVRDLEQQVELIQLIGAGVKAMGMPGSALTQELQALVTGRVTIGSRVVRSMFPTEELRKQFREALQGGRLGELLTGRMGSLRAMERLTGGDWDRVVGSFATAVKNLVADNTRSMFETLSKAIESFTETLNDPVWIGRISAVVDGLKTVATTLAVILGVRGIQRLGGAAAAHLFGVGSVGAAVGSIREFGFMNALSIGASNAAKSLVALTAKFSALAIVIGGITWIWDKWRSERDQAEQNELARIALTARITQAQEEGAIGEASADALRQMLDLGFEQRMRTMITAAAPGVGPIKWEDKPYQNMVEASRAIADVTATLDSLLKGSLRDEDPINRNRIDLWSLLSGTAGGTSGARGWASRGEMSLWTQQTNLLRDMRRNVAIIADHITRHLPRLAMEQV